MAQYTKNPFDVINEAFHGMFNKIASDAARGAITKVIYNEPATVVYWADGEKTVVHCQEGDAYDRRTGLLLCCAKRLFGNTGAYNKVLSMWAGDAE